MRYVNGVPLLDGVQIGQNTPAAGRFGGSSDYFDLSSGGVATLAGTAKRKLTLRPFLEFNVLKQTTKPTSVQVGIFNTYSMPIYDSDNEELFFRMRVPFRWDGSTNPYFKMIVALSGAEDVGDKFQFQFSWMNTSVTGILTTQTVDSPVETTIITDHSAQYSTYSVAFELDWDAPSALEPARANLSSRDNLVGRIRRIAASGNEVDNEILITDWITEWYIDKLYGSW